MTALQKVMFIAVCAPIAIGALIAVYSMVGNNSFQPPLQNQPVLEGLTFQEIGSGLPARLIIKSINVDAPIINVGLAADGSVGVPKGPSQVAWYQLGPRPGSPGSSVITGHFGPWRDGSRSVFDNLNQLKPGDKVEVRDDKGKVLVFIVQETKIYKNNEAPTEVFQKNDGTYLNLITCQGDWLTGQRTYTQRLVVFTELEK